MEEVLTSFVFLCFVRGVCCVVGYCFCWFASPFSTTQPPLPQARTTRVFTRQGKARYTSLTPQLHSARRRRRPSVAVVIVLQQQHAVTEQPIVTINPHTRRSRNDYTKRCSTLGRLRRRLPLTRSFFLRDSSPQLDVPRQTPNRTIHLTS